MTASYQYVDQVRRVLLCAPARREEFMQDLEPLVKDFASERPDASMSDFEEAFGAPEELAQQYMSTLDQEEVRRYWRRKRRLRRASWAVVAILIAAMAIGLAVRYTKVVHVPITRGPTYVIPPGLSVEEARDFLLEAGHKRFGE